MSATEELRRLLGERGASYRERRYGRESTTTIFRAGGTDWHYRENRHGATRLHVDGITPEQAVEATLGRGECENVSHDGGFVCSECGAGIDGTGNFGEYVSYCPNCGRKVRA